MPRICPMPIPWNRVYQQLLAVAATRPCFPPKPPVPLILGGWAFSSDDDKRRRWKDTVRWAKENGCPELVSDLPEKDYYCEFP